jgi:hypothetical protein
MELGRRLSDLKPVEKRKMCKEEVFISIVHGGVNMNIKQIMKTYGMSHSVAHSLSVKTRDYLKLPPENNYSKVRIPERAVAKVEWWREHLEGFPFADIPDTFAENWRADVAESVRPDQMKADKDRRERADQMWSMSQESFKGKEPLNTLFCVLYSPNAVSKLVQHVSENGVCLAHVFVLRDGGVFLLLLTDVDPLKRFPLETFMRWGVHTSAFLWVNLKEACWESHSKTMPLAAVAPTKALKAKQLTKVNDATLCGMHIVALFWMRAKELAVVATGGAELGNDTKAAPAAPSHMYVQPNKDPTTAGDSVGADATTAPWVLKTQAFVDVLPIAEAVAAISADGSSAEVQEQGCLLLVDLASISDENRTAIARAGGIVAVLAWMVAHRSIAGVQQEGCAALANLALNVENKTAIAMAGGIETVVLAMGAHRSIAGMQEQGCLVLEVLGRNKENTPLIASAGGIEAVVAGMITHPSIPGVQQEGCAALANLARNEENRTAMAMSGGIEAIMAGMKAHKSIAGVQLQGCAALGTLARKEANRTLIARAGGIEAVVAGMRAHESIEGVQEQGRRILAKLDLDEENRAAIAKAWEPPPIVRDVHVCLTEIYSTLQIYEQLERSDGGTDIDCWAAQLVGNASVTISTDDNVTSRTVTATYEDGTIAFETVVHLRNDPGVYVPGTYRMVKNTNELFLFWGSKQETVNSDRGMPMVKILPGGRVRLQIRDVHRIDLLQEDAAGVWSVTGRCFTPLRKI